MTASRYRRELADAQLARERLGAPLTARVVRLPGLSRRMPLDDPCRVMAARSLVTGHTRLGSVQASRAEPRA